MDIYQQTGFMFDKSWDTTDRPAVSRLKNADLTEVCRSFSATHHLASRRHLIKFTYVEYHPEITTPSPDGSGNGKWRTGSCRRVTVKGTKTGPLPTKRRIELKEESKCYTDHNHQLIQKIEK